MGIIVGSVAGLVMKSSYPWYVDFLLGIAGAAVGGTLSSLLLGIDLTSGFNLTSLIVSVLGAMLVIWIARLVLRRR
ncbi:GlsB/YeaQ/YmgE family stress response membrane protein [Candidatus Chloroploca sp. Khr17]|uniref:GlsB/YeaQ/YmgE family stress response membrane protein n=1 Tax=Candidatus Chloroploca sp. Khr17 TaxID=2496869 RepID=UPI00101BAB3E|nr:GlsB/YeaQ/YmgE family stress response membrane protein [Candidatus Chloroploca sp. Khr17]